MFKLSRDEQISIAVGLLIISIIAISVFAFKPQRATQGVKVDMTQSNTPAPAPSKKTAAYYPQRIYVHVTGEVLRPNVYAVWKGTRIFEVLAQAGLTADSDAEQLNLAELVKDGERIEVPRCGAAIQPIRNIGGAGSVAGTGIVNLNTASQQELESLPGIGPVYATRIIEYRSVSPFRKKEDLMNVKGIGQKTFDKLKDKITVE